MDCVNSAKLRILLHSLLPAGIPAGALPGALRYDPRVSEPAYLTVAEVARHLRMGARKVYDLAARGNLPHRRVGGRLLFDRAAVDLWLGHAAQAESVAPGLPPAVVAGSHDPLLDWAVRESRCGLALLTQGSSDGLARLAAPSRPADAARTRHDRVRALGRRSWRRGRRIRLRVPRARVLAPAL